MVKLCESMICQRFVQNAWKKDLCSNCFKSKEDHIVAQEKITYTWTAHIDNFPKHGILKDRQINSKPKNSVSFHTKETEIIGFGGEDYSSDDEPPPITFNEDRISVETDNEEDKEFRKLTQSNTDFNSISTNLEVDKPAEAPKYTNLKLGAPQTDSDGRRQTLHIPVEPFKNFASSRKLQRSRLNRTENRIQPVKDPPKEIVTALEKDETISRVVNETRNRENIFITKKMDVVSRNVGTESEVNGNQKNELENERKKVEIENEKNTWKNEKENNLLKNENENITFENEDEESMLKKADTIKTKNDGIPFRNENEKNELKKDISKKENEKHMKSENETEKYTMTNENEINCDLPQSAITVSVGGSLAIKLNDNCDIAEIRENIKTAKSKLEPLFKGKIECKPANLYKLAVPAEHEIKIEEDLNLPLIRSKELEIELDQPGSRELVGEPDGKADSDDSSESTNGQKLNELAFMNPQRSFLHGFIESEKGSPAPVQNGIRKTSSDFIQNGISNPCKTTPNIATPTKRQAPKPPSPKSAIDTPKQLISESKSNHESVRSNSIPESTNSSSMANGMNFEHFLNQRNRSSLNINFSSISNGFGGSKLSTFSGSSVSSSVTEPSTPISVLRIPTKCGRSLSCDSIVGPASAEKSRKYSGATIKMKSTIRKFLKFNSKDDDKTIPPPTMPRKRIEIIHPLDLNKSSIEILGSADHQGMKDDAHGKIDINASRASSPISANSYTCTASRPSKPPPPPRAQSLDLKVPEFCSKPMRPPPPKCNEANKVQHPASSETLNSNAKKSNVYENIGESRQGLAPAKPQRVASIRDRTRTSPLISTREIATEESVNIGNITTVGSTFSKTDNEAIPECDRSQPQSLESSETPSTSSIPYCGSETESDICFQTNVSLCNSPFDDSSRKNKSLVHNSLEDNYGAVVIANHETLSQLLDQVNQTVFVPEHLSSTQMASTLRFSQFKIVESSRTSIADWQFYNARWNETDVVVSLSTKHLGPMKSLPAWMTLSPIVKFTDVVSGYYIKESILGSVQAFITVWNVGHFESMTSYCKHNNDVDDKVAGLVLVQLTNMMKCLQATGIEDVSLNEIVVNKSDAKDLKLLMLPINVDIISSVSKENRDNRMSLCGCVAAILDMLLPKHSLSYKIKCLLSDERATSLSQAKTLVEYWLWGPNVATLNEDRSTILQRWLDLERATFLHKVICKKCSDLSLQEKCQLMFLVRTNAKAMTDASLLTESAN